ncbi:MAG: hypothetical protein QXO86_05935 [Nitrososphaerota archaeon]
MSSIEILCPNCGAPHVISESDLAVNCRYCGVTFRTYSEERRYMLPAYYDSARAIENFLLWVKKQLGYEESLPVHIYIKDAKLHFYPFWTSVIRAKTVFKGVGEDARYSNPYSGGYRSITIIYREEEGSFEKLLEYAIPASKEIPNAKEMVAVSRNRLYFSHEYVRRKNGILHGATLSREEARRIMEESAEAELTRMIAREVVKVNSRSDDLQFSDFTLVYVPVWQITYSFRGRDYGALVDASSSRVLNATYPPDIVEKASYFGVGAAHIGAGVILSILLWGVGALAAATALLGFSAAGIVYIIRGATPTRAAEEVAEESKAETLKRLYRVVSR